MAKRSEMEECFPTWDVALTTKGIAMLAPSGFHCVATLPIYFEKIVCFPAQECVHSID